MAKKINTRSKWDRLRYVICFEVLLILILAPVISFVLEKETMGVGAMAIVLSLKAMLVNVIFNAVYDRVDIKAGRVPTERTPKGRLIHALLFETTLTITSLPIVMWWLDLSLLQALAMDVVIMAFIVVYTYIFTWCYDKMFPVPQPIQELEVAMG